MSDTRSAILAEAEVLIRGRGYSGFSFADLAAVVGIRKASIHHHFPTKADLALSLLAAYDARYDEALLSIEAESRDAVRRIEAYGALYLGGVEKGLGCLCAAFAAELETLPEALRQALTRFFRKHVRWLERVLRDGLDGRSVRPDVDPPAQARLIVAALEGALMIERALDGPSGFETVLDAVTAGLRPAGPLSGTA